MEFLANKMKAVYTRKKIGAGQNATITERGMNCIRNREQERMLRRWKDRVREGVRGGKIRGVSNYF